MTPQALPCTDGAQSVEGWLFDLYPVEQVMVLWMITDAGERLRFVDKSFVPEFLIEGLPEDLEACQRSVKRMREFAWGGLRTRRDVWSNEPRTLQAVEIKNLEQASTALQTLYRRHPGLTYHNCDLQPGALYCYEKHLVPAGRCRLWHREGVVVATENLDDPWTCDDPPMPLREAWLHIQGARMRPRPALGGLALRTHERAVAWDGSGDLRETLESLNAILELDDPDIIWTEGGDTLGMAVLFALAERLGVMLALDRDPYARRRIRRTEGKSLVAYGKVIYTAPDVPLHGRWHIDMHNSFWASATRLEGLIEVVRLTRQPLQRTARRSIGTGLSSLQFEAAWRGGYLIPWKKTQPEGWKTATQLVKTDRGGLVFQPECGVYEDVVEIDFASMFPTIMYRYNVSPDTINCTCCNNEAVPGLGYTICEKRRGLVASVLQPVVEKRAEYKRRRRTAPSPDDRARYDARQNALKWMLVCCFGYLGYRHARFGRIEAHEATTAFAREMLLRSKELVEDRGYHVIHANVDCFWMQQPGMNLDDIARVCEDIEHATGLPITLEGWYSWMVFLPSRVDPRMPVPSCYFGRFSDGTMKYRGIERRRGDACRVAQQVQEHLMQWMARADRIDGVRALRHELGAIVEEHRARVLSGDVELADLAFRRTLSKAADDYRGNSMTATAARQAARAGFTIHPGQAACFVVTDEKASDPMERIRLVELMGPDAGPDLAYYERQVMQAAATVLQPFFGRDVPGLAAGEVCL